MRASGEYSINSSWRARKPATTFSRSMVMGEMSGRVGVTTGAAETAGVAEEAGAEETGRAEEAAEEIAEETLEILEEPEVLETSEETAGEDGRKLSAEDGGGEEIG